MTRALLACVLVTAALGAGCEREQRRFSELAPASSAPEPGRRTELQPGQPRSSPSAAVSTREVAARPTAAGPYDGNAWATSEGKRLYAQMNCVGCHAHGGGGMGPALMDGDWIYGSTPDDIYTSIIEGRPNGMPAFGGKLGAQQVWELVAYVRSMSGQLRKDIRPSRDDHMRGAPPEQQHAPERLPSTPGPRR